MILWIDHSFSPMYLVCSRNKHSNRGYHSCSVSPTRALRLKAITRQRSNAKIQKTLIVACSKLCQAFAGCFRRRPLQPALPGPFCSRRGPTGPACLSWLGSSSPRQPPALPGRGPGLGSSVATEGHSPGLGPAGDEAQQQLPTPSLADSRIRRLCGLARWPA